MIGNTDYLEDALFRGKFLFKTLRVYKGSSNIFEIADLKKKTMLQILKT